MSEIRATLPSKRTGVKHATRWIHGVLLALLSIAHLSGQQPPLFYCPMHPEVTASAPDKCVRCGMALVPGDPYDLREYRLEVDMRPAAPKAGEPVELRFRVRHPSTLALVDNFAVVHDRPFHLFVLSQDLDHYDHVHPERQQDGTYAVRVTLPKAGYYRLYADFLPIGGSPQVISRVITTAGFEGDLAASQARLVADTALSKTAGGMNVSLALPSSGLVAGREETLRYEIHDAKSGAPVTDLEPYLGAFGHTLVMSADTLHYVHAHPVEVLHDTTGPNAPKGGPLLTFKALFPKAGRYRLWTQTQRRGEIATVQFTVDVSSPARR